MTQRPPFDPSKPALAVYESVAFVPDPVWTSVRDAVVAGVPYRIVSERSGIPEKWIRARADAQDWMTPERKSGIIEQYGLHDPEVLARVKSDLDIAAAALTADEALKHRAMVATRTGELLKTAFDGGMLEPPNKWKDAKIADDMARRAFGLEDGPQVQQIIQLGALTEVQDAFPVIDADQQ